MSEPSSTDVRMQSFSFGATLKPLTPAELMLPTPLDKLGSLSLVSRDFSSYEECITSCRRLMDDLIAKVDPTGSTYKMASEVNPIFAGTPTVSRDWAPGEISRVWIFDKKMEGTPHIQAIGQARIFGSTITNRSVTN